MLKKMLFVVLMFAVCLTGVSAEETEKPLLKVEKDGFPSGHTTPEGVACDLARAFIKRDIKLFNDTCIKPYGEGEGTKSYKEFLEQIAVEIAEELKRETPSPQGPKELKKLFAARHLSLNGPGSAGFAFFNFQDVMFVDVGIMTHEDKKFLMRTLVIKKDDNKWYAHPAPETDPLLSAGLNDESDSTIDFSEAYTIEK